MKDENIQKITFEVIFSIGHNLRLLKKEGKITDSKMNTFETEAKGCMSTLCNHIFAKSPWISLFAHSAGSFSLINLTEIPDSCEKWFDKPIQKLVDDKLGTSSLVDDEKKELQKFIRDVVRENEALFRNYNIASHNLQEFFMEYLKGSIQDKSFSHILKMVMTLLYGQADVERGFSLNKRSPIENMSEESLIAQRFMILSSLIITTPMIYRLLRN